MGTCRGLQGCCRQVVHTMCVSTRGCAVRTYEEHGSFASGLQWKYAHVGNVPVMLQQRRCIRTPAAKGRLWEATIGEPTAKASRNQEQNTKMAKTRFGEGSSIGTGAPMYNQAKASQQRPKPHWDQPILTHLLRDDETRSRMFASPSSVTCAAYQTKQGIKKKQIERSK